MFDCWATIAEAGLVEVTPTYSRVVADPDKSDEIEHLLEDLPCTPACAWILKPEPLDRE